MKEIGQSEVAPTLIGKFQQMLAAQIRTNEDCETTDNVNYGNIILSSLLGFSDSMKYERC
jgi:hypothetical protein